MDTPPLVPGPEPGINQKVHLRLETGEYFGPVNDKRLPDGNGGTITYFKNGNVFTGIWKNGQRVKGTTTRPDGKKFTGEWVDDLLYNGSGTASYDNGDIFTGEWKEGEPYTGKGFVHYSGGVYEGELLEGNMHDKGKLTLNNGDIFEGQWKNDKLNGKGEYRNKRIHYIGDFLDDKKDGIGKLVLLSDGSIYEGDFKNNRKKGKGKIIYKDGSTYEGDWDYDMKHGDGKLTDTKGKITFGLWKSNELSETYPILKVSRGVFVEGCLKFSTYDKWENNDIIMLYNPPMYTFDVNKTIDCSAKCTYNICNYMFTREEIERLKQSEDEDEDEDPKIIIKNPYNNQIMDEKHLKIYVLSIIEPPVSPVDPAPAVPEVSSAGGKSKRRQRMKRTYKKNKKKRQTKRKLH